jgi:hypothetical protein
MGSMLIWILSTLLDGDSTYSHVISVIGYSVIPLIGSVVFISFVNILNLEKNFVFYFDLFVKFGSGKFIFIYQ